MGRPETATCSGSPPSSRPTRSWPGTPKPSGKRLMVIASGCGRRRDWPLSRRGMSPSVDGVGVRDNEDLGRMHRTVARWSHQVASRHEGPGRPSTATAGPPDRTGTSVTRRRGESVGLSERWQRWLASLKHQAWATARWGRCLPTTVTRSRRARSRRWVMIHCSRLRVGLRAERVQVADGEAVGAGDDGQG